MEILKRARAKATLMLMARGFNVENISIHKIPKDWENFLNTDDTWIGVEMPESENTTACIYKAKAGVVFKPHKHESNIEHFVITNVGGEVEMVTDTEIYTVKYPDTVLIPMGKPHAVRFVTDTTIFIMWHPKMSDKWDGDFLEEKQIK